ncbi:Voltage-dependent T-type calcium channel subunit alpha-1G [Symbiodinium microadriaticum]|uniref:Voltage-dependent T-type calcium channel subunit alpha-1G n=1 Tax=Symbiodinium microadriaticum TaxID=2951 RepID=A0A1Q9ER31_SYMMI|nr:Voltage-dependent T-type calcium channel subunit alpha-1G [Symbiodinium microadriaticum]
MSGEVPWVLCSALSLLPITSLPTPAMALRGKSVEELLSIQSAALRQLLAVNEALAEAHTAKDGQKKTLAPEEVPVVKTASTATEEPLMKRSTSPAPEGFGIFSQGAMFPDADKMKDKIRSTLFAPEYDPEAVYKTTGRCQAIARDATFKSITMVVIILNALWIGIDTDLNTAELEIESPPFFQVVDNMFCFFFTFEITVRFLAFQNRSDAFKDFSFCFDLSLVATMVWEVWVTTLLVLLLTSADNGGGNLSILRLFRLFRLVRIARVGRLMSSCRELVVLVKGIGMGLRSVLSTLFLMMVVIYIFAIIFTQLFRGSPEAEGCYDGVLQSMNCLMLNVVFPEQQELMAKMLELGPMTYLLGIFYLLVTGLTVMNMLIGVLVEVVSVVAQVDKEESAVKALRDKIQIPVLNPQSCA